MFLAVPGRKPDRHDGRSGRAVWLSRISMALFAGAVMTVSVLCLLPAVAVPPVGISDKIEHLLAYGVLAVLGMSAFPRHASRIAMLIVLMGLGLTLEYLQTFSPGREADITDALANTCGVIVGALVQLLCAQLVHRCRRRIFSNGVLKVAPGIVARAVPPE